MVDVEEKHSAAVAVDRIDDFEVGLSILADTGPDTDYTKLGVVERRQQAYSQQADELPDMIEVGGVLVASFAPPFLHPSVEGLDHELRRPLSSSPR